MPAGEVEVKSIAGEGAAQEREAHPVLLAHAVAFDFEDRRKALGSLPERCGVFALFGEDAHAEPYLAKASHIRRRLERFLSPSPAQSRRLQLAERIRRIEFTETGSDFASDLVFYQAAAAIDRLVEEAGRRNTRDARTRLRLRPAAFLKVKMENRYPRAVVTTRLSGSVAGAGGLKEPVGPFPSKAAAERYLEQVLDLFLLRRCVMNLDPDPAFPGCVYSEMKKCLAPCYRGCTDERYAQEAVAVGEFFRTRGQSLLRMIGEERAAAAESLEFEQAAALHQRYEKVEAVAAQMPEAARPVSELSGVIVQPGSEPDTVDLFLVVRGLLLGPQPYSTLGMRLHNEMSGSSSLYTQPMALMPVPLAEDGATPVKDASRDVLEARLEAVIASLEAQKTAKDRNVYDDHLSLFARWFYRPQTRRIGEVIFHEGDGELRGRSVIRAISRVAASAQLGSSAAGMKPAKWHA